MSTEAKLRGVEAANAQMKLAVEKARVRLAEMEQIPEHKRFYETTGTSGNPYWTSIYVEMGLLRFLIENYEKHEKDDSVP